MKLHLLYPWNVRCTATNIHVEAILGGKTCKWHHVISHHATERHYILQMTRHYICVSIYIYLFMYDILYLDSIKLPTSPYQPVTAHPCPSNIHTTYTHAASHLQPFPSYLFKSPRNPCAASGLRAVIPSRQKPLTVWKSSVLRPWSKLFRGWLTHWKRLAE